MFGQYLVKPTFEGWFLARWSRIQLELEPTGRFELPTDRFTNDMPSTLELNITVRRISRSSSRSLRQSIGGCDVGRQMAVNCQLAANCTGG